MVCTSVAVSAATGLLPTDGNAWAAVATKLNATAAAAAVADAIFRIFLSFPDVKSNEAGTRKSV